MTAAALKDNLDILKKAQTLDREIYNITVELAEIPDLKETLKRELEAEKNHLRDLDASLKKLQLLQKQKEGVLAEKENNIKKLDGQLGQVKTNKEYSALQQEIASLKADNSLLEEEILKILDEVDAAGEELNKEKERLKQVEKEFSQRLGELEAKEKIIAGNMDAQKKQREEIMGQVAPEIRSMYDRIVEKKQGLALVKITGEICGACQLQLRPQVINEIRIGESLVLCDNCSRILYFEADSN